MTTNPERGAVATERKSGETAIKEETPKVQAVRNMEYHQMLEVEENLYTRSKRGELFHSLMALIASVSNILMAFRNIRNNRGANTPGVDGATMDDIAKMDGSELVRLVRERLENFTPIPAKRVEIPKAGGKVRPLGLISVLDKIIEQCILQIPRPIMEAKFHPYSFGFRPDRNTGHAVARFCQLANTAGLHYVVDADIKGFFDNVDHNKLKKQLWTLGIRDKKLLSIIGALLKRPVVMPDGSVVVPERGTPQGGILSPLLANIVLNELDWWISDQWQTFPARKADGSEYASDGNRYRHLRECTGLKPMYLVRYADDFKIFTDTKENAEKILAAVTMWLKERLGLDVAPEKSGVTNLRKRSTDFLGFRLKLRRKGGKWVIFSHMTPKAVKRVTGMLKEQIKRIQHSSGAERAREINAYNSMVMGLHSYYAYATDVSKDLSKINKSLRYTIHNRLLKGEKDPRKGELNPGGKIAERYGLSRQLRFLNGMPILPLPYCRFRAPLNKDQAQCRYTPEGRGAMHKRLGVPLGELRKVMERPFAKGQTVEFINNRISRFCGQLGRCAVTGRELRAQTMHCHHVIPKHIRGPDDSYENLALVEDGVHKLIHAKKEDTILKYLNLIDDEDQMKALNKYRTLAGNFPIPNAFRGGIQLSFFDMF